MKKAIFVAKRKTQKRLEQFIKFFFVKIYRNWPVKFSNKVTKITTTRV